MLCYWNMILLNGMRTSIAITSALAVWKHQKMMELGRTAIQLVLTVITPFWLALWTACGRPIVVAERMSKVMDWDTKPNAPLPAGGADGSSPVHEAGRRCHQTLQAGSQNTHKHISGAVCAFVCVFYFLLWVRCKHSEMHTHLSLRHLANEGLKLRAKWFSFSTPRVKMPLSRY